MTRSRTRRPSSSLYSALFWTLGFQHRRDLPRRKVQLRDSSSLLQHIGCRRLVMCTGNENGRTSLIVEDRLGLWCQRRCTY